MTAGDTSVVRKSTGEKVFWIRDITAVGESCPKCAAMDSRGAATECSPGRKPGVFFRDDLSPVGAKDSFAPTGLVCQNDTYPGLAPGATLCRRSAAEYRRGFQRKLTRKGLDPDHNLDRVCDRRYCKEITGVRWPEFGKLILPPVAA